MASPGLYFLDCSRGAGGGPNDKSTIAFYKNFVEGGNDFTTTDDIIDVQQGFHIWETGTTDSVTFGSGVKFSWNIGLDAAGKQVGAIVGVADNGFDRFVVRKDDNRVMLHTADEFDCRTLYRADKE